MPFPPTVNHCYLTLKNRRRVISPEYRDYKFAMTEWGIRNGVPLHAAQKALKDDQMTLYLKLDLYLPPTVLYTKEGNIKAFDVSNRIKPLEDCLFFLLGIDDRRVWRIQATKHTTNSTQAFCNATIREIFP